MTGAPYTPDELSAIMQALDESEEPPGPFTAAEVEALMDVLPVVESEPDLGAMLAAMEESDRRMLAGLAEDDDLDLSTLIETAEGT